MMQEVNPWQEDPHINLQREILFFLCPCSFWKVLLFQFQPMRLLNYLKLWFLFLGSIKTGTISVFGNHQNASATWAKKRCHAESNLNWDNTISLQFSPADVWDTCPETQFVCHGLCKWQMEFHLRSVKDSSSGYIINDMIFRGVINQRDFGEHLHRSLQAAEQINK